MKLIIAALRRYLMSTGMFLIPFSFMRIWLLRICGVKIGKGCYIGFNVICDTNFSELIVIGNQVTISHNTLILAHTATPARSYLSSFYNEFKKVNISDGAWIGAKCIILPGVSIGENSMVGAGSVVSKATSPYSLYAGNPCRKIKDLCRQTLTKQLL